MESRASTAPANRPCSPCCKLTDVSSASRSSLKTSAVVWEFPSKGAPVERQPRDRIWPARRRKSPRYELRGWSMAHHHRGDAFHVHGSFGLDGRQCFPDPHCREPFRDHQRSHLGADVLPGGERCGDSNFRVARQSLWAKEPAVRVHAGLYGCFPAVRHRAHHGSARDFPHYSRRLRWFAAAFVAGGLAGSVSSQATRQSHGNLGVGSHRCAGAGTGDGRLAN